MMMDAPSVPVPAAPEPVRVSQAAPVAVTNVIPLDNPTSFCNQLMFEVFRRRLTFGAPSAALVQPQKQAAGPASC